MLHHSGPELHPRRKAGPLCLALGAEQAGREGLDRLSQGQNPAAAGETPFWPGEGSPLINRKARMESAAPAEGELEGL